MDKILTKDVYTAHHIPTTPYIGFSFGEWQANKAGILNDIRTKLATAVFVKPARLGSSIGIGKVADNKTEDLEFKIEVALKYCPIVVVENAVENVVDLTCCVLGAKTPVASLVQESRFSADLFDFDAKYLENGGAQLGNAKSSLRIPALIPDDVTKTIQEQSIRIFNMIGGNGIARVDWLFNSATKELFANEINPMPGTLYHHLWKESGVEIGEVLKQLVSQALEREQRRKEFTHTFSSSVLKEAGSIKLRQA
jgi:D-alanine-D-alanine ligase